FNANSLGRVFFTGTRFNPPGANCVSTFSSILFAVTAGTASAAYDLGAGGDCFVEISGKVITPPNTSTGQPEIVTGDRISAPPAPPPPPAHIGALGNAVSVTVFADPRLMGSPLYRMVSGVCN